VHFLSMLMLAVSSNLDNIGVGISYGARKIGLSFLANLIVAVITSLGTLLSMTFGSLVALYLPAGVANCLGSLILIIAGLWVAWREKNKKAAPAGTGAEESGPPNGAALKYLPRHLKTLALVSREPHRADLDYSGHISSSEAVVLGLALTMSNLSTGLGAGLAGLNPLLTTALVFLFSLGTLWGGIQFGNRWASRWLGDRAGLVAGLLLVAIGVYEFFVP